MASQRSALNAISGKERMLDDISSMARFAARSCERMKYTAISMRNSAIAVFAATPLFYMGTGTHDAKFTIASYAIGGLGTAGMLNSLYNSVKVGFEVRSLRKRVDRIDGFMLDRRLLGNGACNIAEKSRKELAQQTKEVHKLGGNLIEYMACSAIGTCAMGGSAYAAELSKMHLSTNGPWTGVMYGFAVGFLALMSGHFGAMDVEEKVDPTEKGLKNLVRDREGINSIALK